jgi:hypothetical protein
MSPPKCSDIGDLPNPARLAEYGAINQSAVTPLQPEVKVGRQVLLSRPPLNLPWKHIRHRAS